MATDISKWQPWLMASFPYETTFLWPDSTIGPWVVSAWTRSQHGRTEVVGFKITAWIDRTEDVVAGSVQASAMAAGIPTWDAVNVEFPTLDSRFFKNLRFGSIVAEAMRWTRAREAALNGVHVANDLQQPASVRIKEWLDARAAVAAEFGGEPTKRGNRDRGDAYYAEVAEVYRTAADAGEPVTAAVARHAGVSQSAAAKQVMKARSRGFLPPTTRGKVGKLQEEL